MTNNNVAKQYTEQDWKLFRKKIIIWQEQYMDKLNKEYAAILNQDKAASEIFWELDKRIREDQRRTGVVVDMRRSVMIGNLIDLWMDKVIELDDLQEFSDTLQETMAFYTSRAKRR